MNCHLAITRVKFVYLIDACVLRRKVNRRFHNKRRRVQDTPPYLGNSQNCIQQGISHHLY